MSTFVDEPIVSSPINAKSFKIPIIPSQKGFEITKRSCINVLKLFQDANCHRDLFEEGISVIMIGKDVLNEIQQTINQFPNSDFKVHVEESPAFLNYDGCLSKIITFVDQMESSNIFEVRQEISKLISELETFTNELRESIEDWKSKYTGWNGKIRNKIKVLAKVVTLKKSLSTSEKEMKDCEIPSYHVDPVNPPVVLGNKNHVKKGTYAYHHSVAEKLVGKFERDDPKLLELKKEISFMKEMSKCENILKVYGMIHRMTGYSVISRWEDYKLQDYLSEHKNLEWVNKLTIAKGIANALNYIHKKKILHYDIKRFESDSPIALKSINEQRDPRWTPPELFQQRSYTRHSEIYSFAIVLWEIASQRTPFEEKILDDIKSLVRDGAHPQPDSTRGTPVAYQKIMEKGWDLDPKQRPTIEEMLKTLNELESEEFLGHKIPRIGDEENVSSGSSNDNKSDDVTSVHTDHSIEYISSAGLTSSAQLSKRKGLEKFNPFLVDLDFDKAIKLHQEKQYKKAWKVFKEIEKRTETSEIKFWAGYYYLRGFYKGNNRKPNAKASIKYLSQAANDGQLDSQYWYAYTILNYRMSAEEHSREHYKVAIEYLRKAANQNYPSALKDLGMIIKYGRYGCAHDVDKGKDMIRKAHTMSVNYSRDGLSFEINDSSRQRTAI
ncbi:11473_t:CDS:2 [Funneliformis geosporum]|uniref:11473_t:CDS:1 n=1 Tax=Funneliformis geosporum TaxID=1117311 RepID=A0A9W4SSZ6_9GLOM|nr:11473_t:CDS:2 [Funneliformis geosporum]